MLKVYTFLSGGNGRNAKLKLTCVDKKKGSEKKEMLT
jgi:hypothetical protein